MRERVEPLRAKAGTGEPGPRVGASSDAAQGAAMRGCKQRGGGTEVKARARRSEV